MRRLVLACLAFAAFGARAAHPLITEDTGTQGTGRWQLEGTSEYEKHGPARVDANAFVLSRGFAEHADWQVTLPWHRTAKDGPGDLSLDLKWRFFERGALSLGLKPGITLPTGSERRDRGTGRVTWGTLLIASYEAGTLAFHSHAGYRENRNTRGERDVLSHYSVAAVLHMGAARLVADVTRDTSPDPAVSRAERYLVLGAIWAARRDFDLDIGLKTGHGSASLDQAVLIGATVRW